MHRCLNVDEILRLIAHELVASGGKATAVGLACCRKSFEDLVLDTLWATQDQLLPLLKTFPEDVWKEDGRKSFKRLPTTTEWARFRKYARRMREFTQFGTSAIPASEVLSVIQLWTTNEPLFTNMKILHLWEVKEWFIPFIPLVLSPRTISVLLRFESDLPEAMVASMITALPTLCPNLQSIALYSLPRDSMITAVVSRIPLITNQNTLQRLCVDSPLTEEAGEVLYKLPNLRSLSVVIERGTSLPSASLPNLTELTITCHDEGDWPRLFHGATFGKLECVAFYPRSEQIGDFLGAFEKAALSSSVQNTLSKLYLSTSHSWSPNYSSLLPFTQMEDLDLEFSCDGGCSSTVDDDILISLSRAMPKLTFLQLGMQPCRQFTTGVTVKGLVALAHHCPDLFALRVHFQVASLSIPLAIPGMAPNVRSTSSWRGCGLVDLVVGEIPVPEESVLMVSLTLIRLFPRMETIYGTGIGWAEVEDAIYHSKGIIDWTRATLETSG